YAWRGRLTSSEYRPRPCTRCGASRRRADWPMAYFSTLMGLVLTVRGVYARRTRTARERQRGADVAPPRGRRPSAAAARRRRPARGACSELAAVCRNRHPGLRARTDRRIVRSGARAVVPVAVRGRVHVRGRRPIVIRERIHEHGAADERSAMESAMEPGMTV